MHYNYNRRTAFGVRNTLISSASLAVMLAASPAHAQQTGQADQAADAEPAGSAPESVGLGVIVVTAEKSEESLQDVAAAVTAFSGDALVQAGATDLYAVQDLVPGARFQPEGNTVQVFLRGVGSNLDFANIEQSVSFNFNGMYVPREGTSAPLYDVQTIQVLPGPQGTLYGRSAIGGVINVEFNRPEFDDSVSGVLEVGNYDLIHGTLVGNIQASDSFAIRAAVDYTYHEGYMETGSDSKDTLSARLGLLYEPTNDFSLYLWGYTVQKYGAPPNLVNYGGTINGPNPFVVTLDEGAFLRDRPWDDLRPGFLAPTAIVGQPQRSMQDYNNWAFGAELDVALSDNVSLTFIPSYFYLDNEIQTYWVGVIPSYKLDKYEQITGEVRLNGTSDRFEWLAGIYGYRVQGRGEGRVFEGTPLQFNSSNIPFTQLQGAAIFGQATYSITDELRFTLGGRYGIDDREADGISLEDQVTPYRFENDYSNFDFKIGVEYDVTPDIMLYATYQTGYQPGTYNETTPLTTRTGNGTNEIDTATLSAISGGFKARFFNDTLQINNEVFFYRYNDLFLQAFDVSQAFNPIFNAGRVTIPGNQLDVLFRPTNEDLISLSVSYIRPRIRDFLPNDDSVVGFSPPYAADWTINAGVSHDFLLPDGYIRAHGDLRYESEYFADFVHTPGVRQPGYIKVNASLTYYDDDGRFSVGIWGQNLTNEATIAAAAAAGIPGPATAYLSPPRTYGIRATFDF
ncbi:TonB-dependent receptor [Parasphingopyxis algicola]|uniref:TonB-dependent receptor n=1 Tax=Parasphingopyxis algicola TaxID=2026624 RepID=UPI0015A4BE73|nr:TonB-dependent receptor [Parasphingopyxis algicola]QLC26492.1 TonB-dependent receptor [Parasphingopyxis algicola]